MALVKEEPYMLALYGSRARGDYDELSDIDILSVGDMPRAIKLDKIGPKLCISHYNWAEFKAMHQYGSLFLHHLKMQSLPFEFNTSGREEYEKLMETLPDYKRAVKDIESFRLSLKDVREALQIGDTTLEFELSSLATTIRHSCILGCYLVGKLEFGRYASVATFCDVAGLPSQIADDFVMLYQFRMMIARNATPPLREGLDAYAAEWLIWAEEIVEEVATCYLRSSVSFV